MGGGACGASPVSGILSVIAENCPVPTLNWVVTLKFHAPGVAGPAAALVSLDNGTVTSIPLVTMVTGALAMNPMLLQPLPAAL